MSVESVSGARGTGNVASTLLKPDVGTAVLELEPNEYPFTVLTKRLRKKNTHNPDFKWHEDDLAPRSDAINNGAGYTSGDTSLVVDTGTTFHVDNLVRVMRTGEVFRVDAVSTNTLTVERGIGSGAAAIVDNDELIVIGSSSEEGSRSRTAVSGNPTEVTNYCQIVKTSVEITETQRHTDTWTSPDEWMRTRNKKAIEHSKDLEYPFLMGRPSKDTSGTHPERTTGGALYYISTNITAAGGALTESELFTFARTGFRYGSKTKLLLASRLLVDVINGFARGKVQMEQSEKTFGVRIFKVISPHGDLNMVTHDLLEGATLGGYGILLDLAQIQYRPLANKEGSRDTHWKPDRQETDRDGQKGEWISEVGQEFGLEKTHSLLTGVMS